MWVIAHTVSGLALGSLLLPAGLWAIVPAALLLHILLDAVPHWDYISSPYRHAASAADVICSAATLMAARMVFDAEWVVVIAGVVSALPDLDIFNDTLLRGRGIKLFPSHWRSFPHGSAPPLPGVATQAVVITLSVLVFAAHA